MSTPTIAHRNLEYARVTTFDGDMTLLLDVYVPADTRTPMPAVLWLHGGGWREGSKDGWGADNAPRLCERGYVVAVINYRLSQQAHFPAAIHDCKSAVRWLRAHAKAYDIDPDRIGVAGGSAGAHLASLLGVTNNLPELEGDGPHHEQSSSVKAVFSFAPVTDLVRIPDDHDDQHALWAVSRQFLGAPVREREELARQASPLHHVASTNPPHLFLHGDADTVVPCIHSRVMHEALLQAGVDSELIIVPGGGHGGGMPDLVPILTKFFAAKL